MPFFCIYLLPFGAYVYFITNGRQYIEKLRYEQSFVKGRVGYIKSQTVVRLYTWNRFEKNKKGESSLLSINGVDVSSSLSKQNIQNRKIFLSIIFFYSVVFSYRFCSKWCCSGGSGACVCFSRAFICLLWSKTWQYVGI